MDLNAERGREKGNVSTSWQFLYISPCSRNVKPTTTWSAFNENMYCLSLCFHSSLRRAQISTGPLGNGRTIAEKSKTHRYYFMQILAEFNSSRNCCAYLKILKVPVFFLINIMNHVSKNSQRMLVIASRVALSTHAEDQTYNNWPFGKLVHQISPVFWSGTVQSFFPVGKPLRKDQVLHLSYWSGVYRSL